MNNLAPVAKFSLRNSIRTRKFIILLAVGLALLLVAFFFRPNAQAALEHPRNGADHRGDMLAYVSDDGHLMLYNPRDRTEITLLDGVQDFVLGQKGRVAFTKQAENDPDLYVFDPSTPAVAPINISEGLAANNTPLGWSLDERYLAFDSYASSDKHNLYVWDGATAINVMPNNGLARAERFYVNWSSDDRLAFTVVYGWLSSDVPPDIYLWDDSTTTDLSQNPAGWDGSSGWSKAGQLMFSSTRNGETGIYVWDGVSFKDGAPDRASFIRLTPKLTPTNAIWTEDGLVGFTRAANVTTSGRKEIVIWDLEKDAFVKQFPVSSRNSWSWLAEGGQVVLSSQLASGLPSYDLDVENTRGAILLSVHTGESAWSSDGYLAFCGIEDREVRVLSLWDGQESWVIARVSYKPVQWQHGETTFSCNNG